jgi:hypothetical protein
MDQRSSFALRVKIAKQMQSQPDLKSNREVIENHPFLTEQDCYKKQVNTEDASARSNDLSLVPYGSRKTSQRNYSGGSKQCVVTERSRFFLLARCNATCQSVQNLNDSTVIPQGTEKPMCLQRIFTKVD